MKPAIIFCLSAFLIAQLPARAADPYDGSWESLQKMPVPAWFDDGKIGIFIHWGPYSVLGYIKGDRGYAEQVPKAIYSDPKHLYPLLKQRFGAAPPEFGYKDMVEHFKAEKWDPEAWATLFEEVGAKYVVLTAEHHDGWANWDSDLTPWNAMDKGPKRDLVGELGAAVRKRGLKYAPSTHRERHHMYFSSKNYVADGEPFPDIAKEIELHPEAASLYGPFDLNKAFADDYVARWKEIEKKYQPDFLWIDDIPLWTRDGNNVPKGEAKPEIQYFYDQLRLMITGFMNQAAARGQEVYLNNKGGKLNWPEGVGCREKDNLRLAQIGPKWQSCTTFGTSFGYLAAEEADDYPYTKKNAGEVIHEMIEVVSRNGNFLINIGPRADGTIPEGMERRLLAIGRWLAINGEAIYGTRPWKKFGEGLATAPPQGASRRRPEQPINGIRFTAGQDAVYAILLEWPADGKISLQSFASGAGLLTAAPTAVTLLGHAHPLKWSRTADGLRVELPAEKPCESAFVLKIAH